MTFQPAFGSVKLRRPRPPSAAARVAHPFRKRFPLRGSDDKRGVSARALLLSPTVVSR